MTEIRRAAWDSSHYTNNPSVEPGKGDGAHSRVNFVVEELGDGLLDVRRTSGQPAKLISADSCAAHHSAQRFRLITHKPNATSKAIAT